MPRTAGARSRYVDTGFEAPSNDGGMPPPAPKPKAPPPPAMKIFTPSRPAAGEGEVGSSEGGYQAPSGYQPPSNEVGGEDEQAGAGQ